MEPRREESKTPMPRPEEKQKRFRLIRLEERIAPSKGGKGTNNCPTANLYSCIDTFCGCGTASIE
jgi:hypothetical protein